MALKWLRDQFKHLKIILWAVVAVFVLLVFNEWGSGGMQGRGSGDYAIRVGDVDMSEEEFVLQMQALEREWSSRLGEQWQQFRDQIDLAERVRQQFIFLALHVIEARTIGLVVTDEEVKDTVVARFSPGGKFVGTDRYEAYVRRSMRKSPRQYEEEVRRDLLALKLAQMVRRGVHVSDAEAERVYRSENETADFDAIQIRFESFLSDVTVDDAEIQAHYDANPDEFHRDEQRVIRYLVVETTKLRRILPVEDAEIEEYFQEHRDEFKEQEKAQIRHVLIRIPPEADQATKADAKMRADAVAHMARSGAEFAELARLHSEDTQSKEGGGLLPWTYRGSMDKAFADEVFQGKPGDIIGPILSQHGFHVVKIEGYQPERLQELDDVREKVRFQVVEGRAAAEAESRAIALEARLTADLPQDDQSWQQIADEDEAVVLNISPPFRRDETAIPGITDDPELVAAVFEAEPGAVGGARAISRGWMVWQLKEIQEEGIAPLVEVRGQVEQQVERNKALELAAKRAEELAERWHSGADGQELASEVQSTVAEARGHRRGRAVPGEIGIAPALERAVFASEVGAVVGPVGVGDRAVALARVNSLDVADAAEVAAGLEGVRTRLIDERAQGLLAAILQDRRRETKIVVDPAVMDRYGPRE